MGSKKRQRESADDDTTTNKKAKQSITVNIPLVDLYEQLAHEDEDVRLKAAHDLLTNHTPNADQDQIKTILRRLFRGLCSGRKAARLGFSVALTETLTQLKDKEALLGTVQVLEILESQTTPESNTSGQDERDHYFGRLFGSDAIIKSEILFNKAEVEQWRRLLDLVCGISAKKPWLRQECGWILYNCIRLHLQTGKLESFAVEILEKLNQHKLIRTPEGLAIWVEVQRAFPQTSLPKNVWKYDDPLAKKDLKTLGQVLKDAKIDSKENAEYDAQGSATWSGHLHFVWDVALLEVMKSSTVKGRVSPTEFWQTAVDEGLFAPSGSAERKQWGLLLLQKAFTAVPSELLGICFSKNAVSCLIVSLKADDRYLKRTAQRALQVLQSRAQTQPDSVPAIVSGLFRAGDMIDFDTVTKTKTVERLFGACETPQLTGLASAFADMLDQPGVDEQNEVITRRRNIINIQYKFFSHLVSGAVGSDNGFKPEPLQKILSTWASRLIKSSKQSTSTPSFSESTISLIREKLTLALEQALKLNRIGRHLVLQCIATTYGASENKLQGLSADQEVVDIVNNGWRRFKKLEKKTYQDLKAQNTEVTGPKSGQNTNDITSASATEGIVLLYALVLFQIYNDDVDAIEVLGELLEIEEQAQDKQKQIATNGSAADALIEILLGFASKPSKFLRRITLDIFGSFTSEISASGLDSLISILETEESAAGQHELFDANGQDVDEEGDTDTQDGSDGEMIDSDVEIVDAEEGSSSEGSDSGSEDDPAKDDSDTSESDEGNEEGQNAGLLALEKSLAEALGTRKLTSDDMADAESSSNSDADMTDSEMMELDTKLAEVFRNRQTDSARNKKNEQKSAKENIVNFKNRVLDMTDVYFKQEHTNPNTLKLLLPLLQLARQSKTKQLTHRAIEVLRTLCTKCKGLDNAPSIHTPRFTNGTHSTKKKNKTPAIEPDDTATTTTSTLSLLRSIHAESALPTSNAHKATCSQISLLVVKTLLKANVSVATVVDVYAATRVKMLTDSECKVNEGLFTDWGNWCGSMRGKF